MVDLAKLKVGLDGEEDEDMEMGGGGNADSAGVSGAKIEFPLAR